MRLRRMLALFAVMAMVALACGDSADTTTTDAAPPVTDAPTTTVPPTTMAPTTTVPPDDGGTTTTTSEMMDLTFDQGFDEESGTIRLGVLAATTGPIADIGQSLLAGHQAFWERINSEGGVNGQYPVELVIRDNAYNPEQNVVVYNEIKSEVAAFSSTIGTPTTATIWEDARDNDLLVAAGSLASQWALTPNVILNLGANTYFAQFANGPYWAMEIADPPIIDGANTPVGIIYQADDYGQDCKNGYDFAQANLGFNDAYQATYAVGDSEFSAQIGGAQAAGVEVLFICALPSVLAPMVGTMAALQYLPKIFGSSPSYIPILNGALGGGDPAAGAALFNQFPYYNLGTSAAWESDFPGFQQMRADHEASGLPPEVVTAFYFFGWTQAATFHEILKVAFANGDITKLGLLAAVDQVQDIDLGLGGSPAGYGTTPKDRLPTNEDAIGLVTTDNVFGLEPISDFFVAPWLEEWDPAG